MKTTNNSRVTYIDHMGSDLTVVNAARVSFDKESSYVTVNDKEALSTKDKRLISYLASHNHWSPFAHTAIQLRIDAPIFVARQLVKHQVGGVWNEVSRRYVDYEPEFYIPDEWRGRPINSKQGSDGLADNQDLITSEVEGNVVSMLDLYNKLLESGVAPEQARMVLPQNAMTSWYWTGSLLFFHRVWSQRVAKEAQKETRDVALQIGDICSNLFPVSWGSLIDVPWEV